MDSVLLKEVSLFSERISATLYMYIVVGHFILSPYKLTSTSQMTTPTTPIEMSAGWLASSEVMRSSQLLAQMTCSDPGTNMHCGRNGQRNKLESECGS